MAAGTGRRGVIGSSAAPSAWSRRSSNPLPKRAANGARGRVGQIGDAGQTGRFQIRDDLRIDAQRRDRQRQHGRFGFAARDDRTCLP